MFELTLGTVLMWIIAVGVTIILIPFIASMLIGIVIFSVAASVAAFVGIMWFVQTIAEWVYTKLKTTMTWFKRTSGTRPS